MRYHFILTGKAIIKKTDNSCVQDLGKMEPVHTSPMLTGEMWASQQAL